MRAVGLLCALAALTGCSESQSPSASETGRPGAVPAGWALKSGTYEYSRADGVAGLYVLAKDGSYTDVRSGGDLVTGTWRNEEGRSCLVSADASSRQCYRFTAPNAQGRFTGTAADGSTMTARMLE